eukprot:4098221-Prymnesium_polylepis.1
MPSCTLEPPPPAHVPDVAAPDVHSDSDTQQEPCCIRTCDDTSGCSAPRPSLRLYLPVPSAAEFCYSTVVWFSTCEARADLLRETVKLHQYFKRNSKAMWRSLRPYGKAEADFLKNCRVAHWHSKRLAMRFLGAGNAAPRPGPEPLQ